MAHRSTNQLWRGSRKHEQAEGHQRARARLKNAFAPLPGVGGGRLPPALMERILRVGVPVDRPLSFPDTVAVMGGSEVTKLLKPACLPFINVTFKAPSVQVNHNYISRGLWYIPSP